MVLEELRQTAVMRQTKCAYLFYKEDYDIVKKRYSRNQGTKQETEPEKNRGNELQCITIKTKTILSRSITPKLKITRMNALPQQLWHVLTLTNTDSVHK